jgi:hypothetical protein
VKRNYDVVVVNPLGGALHHYADRLLKTLTAAGMNAHVITVLEPSVSGKSRLGWLVRYAAALAKTRHLRHERGRVIVTWPVLGHVDRVMIRILSGRNNGTVVMHDPRPLVAAVGYGSTMVRLGQALAAGSQLVVHSELAEDDLRSQRLSPTLLAHPVIAEEKTRTRNDRPVLRVLGQWKPDRDIRLMADLVSRLPGIDLEVVGRGWPAIEGWAVRDEFVTEKELDELVMSSTAVLIPYRRFYQSGIAARALESAVPVVGRKKELASMTGDQYPFLVDAPFAPDAWATAVEAAIGSNDAQLERVRSSVTARALQSWSDWGRS